MRASEFAGRTLAIAIVLTTLASCGGDDSVQPQATPPPFFPLAVGNRWSYIESLVTRTGTWVKVDTVLVVGVRTHDGATWYEIHGRFNPTIAASEFTARNDSVFSLQHTEAPGGLAPVKVK